MAGGQQRGGLFSQAWPLNGQPWMSTTGELEP
jgi:hypothetical protein